MIEVFFNRPSERRETRKQIMTVGLSLARLGCHERR